MLDVSSGVHQNVCNETSHLDSLRSWPDHLGPNILFGIKITFRGTEHIADMRAVIRKNMVEELATSHRFGDLGSLLAWLASCDLCAKCLNACPLYDGELDHLLGRPSRNPVERAPLAELVAISHWLVSCGGCGMCEETCAQGVPLVLLVSALSHRIRGELHYTSGDAAQRLPWMP